MRALLRVSVQLSCGARRPLSSCSPSRARWMYAVSIASVAAAAAGGTSTCEPASGSTGGSVRVKDISPQVFDHTALKPDITKMDIDKLCDEALKYNFYSVCVNSANVPQAVERTKGSAVKVVAVVGFPLGAMLTPAKVVEAQMCLAAGAAEIDMVANTGLLKSGDYNAYRQDIEAVVQVCRAHRVPIKVILETCLLTEDEKVAAGRLALGAGAEFLKTSTGFSSGGATVADVRLLSDLAHHYFTTHRNADGKKEVSSAFCKASGGIRTGATALQMLEAGADRLGTSATVAVYLEAKEILNKTNQ